MCGSGAEIADASGTNEGSTGAFHSRAANFNVHPGWASLSHLHCRSSALPRVVCVQLADTTTHRISRTTLDALFLPQEDACTLANGPAPLHHHSLMEIWMRVIRQDTGHESLQRFNLFLRNRSGWLPLPTTSPRRTFCTGSLSCCENLTKQ